MQQMENRVNKHFKQKLNLFWFYEWKPLCRTFIMKSYNLKLKYTMISFLIYNIKAYFTCS